MIDVYKRQGIALCIYLVTAYIGIRWKFRLIVNVNSKSLAGAIYFVAIFIVLGEFMVDMLILQQPTSMIFTHSCLVFLFALANICLLYTSPEPRLHPVCNRQL